FQIRRSNTSATPGTTLNGGELGYSFNTNSLFIGAQTGVGTAGFRIGGSNYAYLYQSGVPGVLTANAVPITDANSYMNNTFTQGLVVQTSTASAPSVFINSVSNTGNSSQIGANTSGGGMGTEFATTAAISGYVVNYVAAHGATPTAGGSNTQIQFNDSTVFNGQAGFTYTKTTNTVFVGNTIQAGAGPGFTANNILTNAAALNVVGQTNTATAYVTTSINVGTAFTANTLLTNTNNLNVVNQVNAATLYATTTANVGTLQLTTTQVII